jgi:hypothetical protein
MTKVVWLLIVATLGCKLITGRWPWELTAGSARSKAQARARALLGVGKTARREEVLEAHKRLIAMVHPDRGGTGEQVHEANAARDLLLAEIAQERE